MKHFPAFVVAAVAITLPLWSIAPSYACDVSWGDSPEPPSWQRMVDKADLVFVGRVISTTPETFDGFGRATFEVESWIRGGSAKQFIVANGDGGNCVAGFAVGSRVIFVGEWLRMSSGETLATGEDTGWDGMAYLSDPPTSEQQAQLDYLKTIAEIR